ncbi:MAG: hypothetical protein R2814_12585 [Flavobacteriaceae bacterium]
MWYKEDNFKVKIGGNYYIDTPNIIVYKGESLFSIVRAESTELLGINFVIHNNSGSKIATVKQGRIYEGDKDLYTVHIAQDSYTLIEKESGRTICDIKKRKLAEQSELEVTVNMYTKDGFLIEATPTGTNIGTSTIQGSTFKNCGAGIAIN